MVEIGAHFFDDDGEARGLVISNDSRGFGWEILISTTVNGLDYN